MSDGPRDTDVQWWHSKGKLAPVERLGSPMTLREFQREAHAIAVEKGWWDQERNIGEVVALIHSEISEALEEYRKYGPDGIKALRWVPVMTNDARYAGLSKPEGFFVELADAVIRIADLFERYGVSMEDVIRAKMAYNRTRPYRHGGKQA